MPQAETNVRLLSGAHDALYAIASVLEASRDETVRIVLAEYVERQEQREPADRLTHISTVLRYPPPPQSRGETREDLPLRVRAPRELIDRARAVSLRLPGQSPRAHRDYQSRELTDAVTTAIAAHAPIRAVFPDGLLPVIRHRAAVKLWQLAVAVTSAGPERPILEAAANHRHGLDTPPVQLSGGELAAGPRLLKIAEALENNEAWHSRNRFIVAATIARELLAGAHAAANEAMLHQAGGEFEDVYLDILQADEVRRAALLAGTDPHSETGRGGTAAWRASAVSNSGSSWTGWRMPAPSTPIGS